LEIVDRDNLWERGGRPQPASPIGLLLLRRLHANGISRCLKSRQQRRFRHLREELLRPQPTTFLSPTVDLGVVTELVEGRLRLGFLGEFKPVLTAHLGLFRGSPMTD
jgi:hypothetical protein